MQESSASAQGTHHAVPAPDGGGTQTASSTGLGSAGLTPAQAPGAADTAFRNAATSPDVPLTLANNRTAPAAATRAATAPVFSIGSFMPALKADAESSTAVSQAGKSASQQPATAIVFGVGAARSSRAAISVNLQSEARIQGPVGSLTLPAAFKAAPAAPQTPAEAGTAKQPSSQPANPLRVPQQPQDLESRSSAQEQQTLQQEQRPLMQQQYSAPPRPPARKAAYKPPDILVRHHVTAADKTLLPLIWTSPDDVCS